MNDAILHLSYATVENAAETSDGVFTEIFIGLNYKVLRKHECM